MNGLFASGRTSSGNPENHLRARDNLSFLEFIDLVSEFWSRAHPDIPILPAHSGAPSVQYPLIVWGLELRKVHPQDPKPRYRESVSGHDDEALIISGQRFQNVVKFTVVADQDRAGARLTSEIIEVFEDFMQEYIPAFKEAGASELIYSRRYPDDEENRPGADVVRRSVAYLVTTEKVTAIEYGRFDQIVVEARTWLQNARSNPVSIGTSLPNVGPRYYGFSLPTLKVGENNKITIPDTSFMVGDLIYVMPKVGFEQMPVEPGYYFIQAFMGTPWSHAIEYEIVRPKNLTAEGGDTRDWDIDNSTPVEPGEGEASVAWIPDPNVTTRIVDQQLTVPRTQQEDDSG